MAASPGGKSILLADFFPKAELFANDITEKKVKILQENFAKYGIKASISVGDGAEFESNIKFDLVIVDAPCSNSGCLYKCPEARWRLTKEDLAAYILLQKKLLQSARKLVSDEGFIIYSTCSILPEENKQGFFLQCPNLK